VRFFPLLDFQEIVLALFLGLVTLILVVVAWGGYSRRPPGEGPPQAPDTEVPGSVPGTERNPVAPILLFVFAGVAAGALGYAVFVWLLGRPVGY
jgi:hypothetical protein